MSGNRTGGLKVAVKMKQRYGNDVYAVIGRAGGLKSTGGGFALNRALAVEAGRKGGKALRRKRGL